MTPEEFRLKVCKCNGYVRPLWDCDDCPLKLFDEIQTQVRDECAKAVCPECRQGVGFHPGGGHHVGLNQVVECEAEAIRALGKPEPPPPAPVEAPCDLCGTPTSYTPSLCDPCYKKFRAWVAEQEAAKS